MTAAPEEYADLARLADALDHAMPAPPQVETTLRHILAQQSATAPETLSRKGALKAGMAAAGAAWLLALGRAGPAIAGEFARHTQEGPMTAARLGDILRGERAQWDALLARVGPERMDLPNVEGTWSVKQIVAHLTWYEAVIVEGAQKIMSTGTFVREGLRALSIDERNAILADQSRARPVREILDESERVFRQLLAVVSACPDDILNDPRRLGLPDDVVPWMLVANNSYAHYQEHAQAIVAWLDA
jgi:hypothetical protein